jgi:hypothetical protein
MCMSRAIFSIAASFAILSGCTIHGSAALSNAPVPSAQSWAAREATSEDLLYISDLGTNLVDIVTYPAGKMVGQLSGFGAVAGLCVDKAGDVFVVDEAGPVQMFAHGGSTPLRKLTTYGAPYGCAVDPVTGNLALTNLSSYTYGVVAIYPKAKGKPKLIKDYDANTSSFCGYDTSGNLFIDGTARSEPFVLWELRKGKSSVTDLKFSKKVDQPGGVQFDGTYVAVGDYRAGFIYRTKHGTGEVAQTVTLKSGMNVQQFWIQGSTLVGESTGEVPYYHYPRGGSPYKEVLGFSEPIAAAVSLAKTP